MLSDDLNITLTLNSYMHIVKSIQAIIAEIEKGVNQLKLRPEDKKLLSVSGIGESI